jgi:hypothetical protein
MLLSGSMSITQRKKLKWFDAGAAAFRRQQPDEPRARSVGRDGPPMYVCPICVRGFPRSSLASGELTAEHVPPECFGGRELVLTCKGCNNTAGSTLDAHADRKESVASVLEGRLDRVQNVKVIAGGVKVNAELTSTNRQFSVRMPDKINRPGAADQLRGVLRQGSEITVEFSGDAFAELGAKISWLRSGYLLLFAVFGYSPVFDPALQIVQHQILEPSTSLMRTFTIELPEQRPWSERRLIKVFEPDDQKCWAVQFGRYCVLFPLARDISFYDRLGRDLAGRGGRIRGDSYGWPKEPMFGLPEPASAG